MVLRDRYARVAALLCVVAFGCASGGVPRLGGDADVDTNTGGKHDAPPFDATPPTDGAVDSMPPIDAMMPPDASGNPLFCSDNTQCVDPGTCCFIAACVAGTAVGNNLCFPQ
jgi:hypothetical protein